MVNTRSSSNNKQEETIISVSNKSKRYFRKMIEPLIINKSLKHLFTKLKDDLLKKLDEKISKQITAIEKLESIISVDKNTMKIP